MPVSSKFFLVGMAFLTACTTTAHEGQTSIYTRVDPPHAEPAFDRRGYSVNPDDFHGVYFKERQPGPGTSLLPALSTTLGDSKAALRHDFGLMSSLPANTQFTVVGFTDDSECEASQCSELSLRRAQLVHDWLISEGFPSDRLSSPHGFGSTRPIGDNSSSSGRAKNRRAHISYGPELDSLKNGSTVQSP